MSLVMNVFGWFSVIVFGLLGLNAFVLEDFLGALFLFVLAVLVVPNFFWKVVKFWKKQLEARNGKGSAMAVGSFLFLFVSWVFAIIVMGPGPVVAPEIAVALKSIFAQEPADSNQESVAEGNISKHIKSYKIKNMTKTGFGEWKRWQVFIVSAEPMTSMEDFIYTGIKAAKDIATFTKADVIGVSFAVPQDISPKWSRDIVRVNHYVDGMGSIGWTPSPVWEVSVVTPLPRKSQIDFMAKVVELSDMKEEISFEEYYKRMRALTLSSDASVRWTSEYSDFDVSRKILRQMTSRKISTAQTEEIERVFGPMQ